MKYQAKHVCKTCSAHRQNLVFIEPSTFMDHFEKEHNCVFTRDCWRHIVDFNSPFGIRDLNKAMIQAKIRQMENW